MKEWLLKGLSVAEDDVAGQTSHVHLMNVPELELRPEEDLDAEMRRRCL